MKGERSNEVKGPTHDGPAPQYTGGNHPRGKLLAGDCTGIGADDALEKKGHELGAAEQVHGPGLGRSIGATKGYVVLSPSPVSGAEPYDNVTRGPREYVGIDIDEDQDGSYTGGTGNGKAT